MDKKLWELFLAFLKIGLFTFGGGYAMIPLIQRETVEKRHWITDQNILEITAIAESTPGPIAVNAATFVGYRAGGFYGAVLATLGVITPSFIIILGVSYILETFEQLATVRYAFFGIRAGILGLIVRAMWSMYRQCPKNPFSCSLMGIAFCAAVFLRLDVILVIICCAIAGLTYHLYLTKQETK